MKMYCYKRSWLTVAERSITAAPFRLPIIMTLLEILPRGVKHILVCKILVVIHEVMIQSFLSFSWFTYCWFNWCTETFFTLDVFYSIWLKSHYKCKKIMILVGHAPWLWRSILDDLILWLFHEKIYVGCN